MFWKDGVQGKTNQDEQREAETWGWKEEMQVPETDKGLFWERVRESAGPRLLTV